MNAFGVASQNLAVRMMGCFLVGIPTLLLLFLPNSRPLKPLSRRNVLLGLPLLPSAAHARGLVKFPVNAPLLNSYHFLRSGTSLLEEEGIWSTNPLFLTNRDDALSAAGEEQVRLACAQMRQGNRLPTLVKYSLAAKSIDTANLVGQELNLGRDRLVPEFTFLDPRGIGRYDMTDLSTTQSAIFALDNDEAGTDGLGGRPPPNDDGTPHEVLQDQAIRLRQVMSILETQFSGESILLVFPDGTGPALLSCMFAGIPYYRVHELEFAPGEARFDVTKDSVLSFWKGRDLDGYRGALEQGRQNLDKLRNDATSIVNLKDQKIENERMEVEQAVQAKEEAAQQRAREKELERERVRREMEEQRKQERAHRLAERESQDGPSGGQVLRKDQLDDGDGQSGLGAVGAVGAGIALGVAALSAGSVVSSEDERLEEASPVPSSVSTGQNATDSKLNDRVQSKEVELQPKMAPFATENDEENSSYAKEAKTDSVSTLPKEPSPVKSSEETVAQRREAARSAMDEYMQRDDGLEEWLQSIAEIIDESDDEVVYDENADEWQ